MPVADTEKIEDAIITLIQNANLGFKTIMPWEPEIDLDKIAQLVLRTPFCLIVTLDEEPGGDRAHDDSFLSVESGIVLLIGSSNLRDKQSSQRGVYSFLRSTRNLLDGKTLVVDNVATDQLSWQGNHFEFRVGGMIAYSQPYRFVQ